MRLRSPTAEALFKVCVNNFIVNYFWIHVNFASSMWHYMQLEQAYVLVKQQGRL